MSSVLCGVRTDSYVGKISCEDAFVLLARPLTPVPSLMPKETSSPPLASDKISKKCQCGFGFGRSTYIISHRLTPFRRPLSARTIFLPSCSDHAGSTTDGSSRQGRRVIGVLGIQTGLQEDVHSLGAVRHRVQYHWCIPLDRVRSKLLSPAYLLTHASFLEVYLSLLFLMAGLWLWSGVYVIYLMLVVALSDSPRTFLSGQSAASSSCV